MVQQERLLRDLRSLDGSVDKIAALSSYMALNVSDAKVVCKVWMSAFEAADASRVLPLLYLANDVLQRTRAKNNAYVVELAKYLPAAYSIAGSRAPSSLDAFGRLASLWTERQVFSATFMDRLRAAAKAASEAAGGVQPVKLPVKATPSGVSASAGNGSGAYGKSNHRKKAAAVATDDNIDDDNGDGADEPQDGDAYGVFSTLIPSPAKVAVSSSTLSPVLSFSGSGGGGGGGGGDAGATVDTAETEINHHQGPAPEHAHLLTISATEAVNEGRRRARLVASAATRAATTIPQGLRSDATVAALARAAALPDNDVPAAHAQVTAAEFAARVALAAAQIDLARRPLLRDRLATAVGEQADRLGAVGDEMDQLEAAAVILRAALVRERGGATVRCAKPKWLQTTTRVSGGVTASAPTKTPSTSAAAAAAALVHSTASVTAVSGGGGGGGGGGGVIDNDDDLIADDDFLGFGNNKQSEDDIFDPLVADDGDLFAAMSTITTSATTTTSTIPPTSRSGVKRERLEESGSGSGVSTSSKRAAVAVPVLPTPAARIVSSLFLSRSGDLVGDSGLIGDDDFEEEIIDQDSAPAFVFDTTGGNDASDGRTWDPIRKEWRAAAPIDPDAWRAT